MTALRPELPPLVPRIDTLPVDKRGYPVPWFVATVDGEPDHRVMDGRKIQIAWERQLCWVCGQPYSGPTVTFAIGPMCAVNRVSAEPPSHKECVLWSVKGCPFLSRPHAHRRETGMPEGHVPPDGIMLRRNPGVMLLWTVLRTKCGPFPIPEGGMLFNVGEPREVEWYSQGRLATRAEVLSSIESGLPTLQGLADEEGPGAQAALADQYEQALELLPAA